MVFITGVGGAAGISWMEARDAAKSPTMHRTAHTVDRDLAQMLIVLRLGNPLEEGSSVNQELEKTKKR